MELGAQIASEFSLPLSSASLCIIYFILSNQFILAGRTAGNGGSYRDLHEQAALGLMTLNESGEELKLGFYHVSLVYELSIAALTN